MEDSITMHLEGNRIIMDVVDDGEDSDGVMLVRRAPSLQAQQQKADQQSFMERLMGVRNKQCELNLACISDKYETQKQYNWSKRQSLEDRVRYDHRVMKVDIHRNWLEKEKRRNPDFDTSFDELLIKHASKYLNVDPEDCCHLRHHNRYPLRNTLIKCGCTPTIAKARQKLQELEINREVEKIRQHQLELQDNVKNDEFNAENTSSEHISQINDSRVADWVGEDTAPKINISNDPPIPTRSTSAKLRRSNTWASKRATPPAMNQGEAPASQISDSEDASLHSSSRMSSSFPPITSRSGSAQQQQLKMRRASLDLSHGRRSSLARSTSSLDLTQVRSRASSASQMSRQARGSAKRDPTMSWLEEEEEPEYDNEEIMRKLREAGIIKKNEVINFTGHGPVSTFLDDETPDDQPKRDQSTPPRVVRKRLTMDMLKEEEATIKHKIAAFYKVLERDKDLEHQKAKLLQQMKALKQQEDEGKQKVSLGKYEMNEQQRKFNLLSSFRSKIMKEKWKIATSKIILNKCEEELSTKAEQPTEAQTPTPTPTPTEQRSQQSTPKKESKDRDHLKQTLKRDREARAKQLAEEPFQGFGYRPQHRAGGTGAPIYSKRRSDRHTPTFKLAKIVEDILRKKSKHQLMEYNRMKNQMLGNTLNLETIEENEDQG